MPPRLATKRNLTRIAVIAAVVFWNCACSQKPPSAAAPVEVSVMTVTPHPVTFSEDYVAQTEAINAVEIRPRVGGTL
jgi:multidrug efflux pump subunit AcrA (membrane-fusion protein)